MVAIDAVIPEHANGVLYKLGGFPGGVTCFAEDGITWHAHRIVRRLRGLPAARIGRP